MEEVTKFAKRPTVNGDSRVRSVERALIPPNARVAPRYPLTRTYTPGGAVERWLELPSNSADQVAEPTESLNVALK